MVVLCSLLLYRNRRHIFKSTHNQERAVPIVLSRKPAVRPQNEAGWAVPCACDTLTECLKAVDQFCFDVWSQFSLKRKIVPLGAERVIGEANYAVIADPALRAGQIQKI